MLLRFAMLFDIYGDLSATLVPALERRRFVPAGFLIQQSWFGLSVF